MPLLCSMNPLTAYQFDAAVVLFGTALENALQERVEGADKKSRPKYKLDELLNDTFQFQPENTLDVFRGLDGYSEVR